MILLRIGKRAASWEDAAADPSVICETEFKTKAGHPIFEVSVYELDSSGQVVQACAEHAASYTLDYPRRTVNVDLAGMCAGTRAPGESRFTFTREAHRNVAFTSREAQIAIVARVLTELGRRAHVVTREEVCEYAKQRHAASDSEWTAFFGTCSKSSWQKLVDTG